jgi:hypothetical protein
VGRVVGSVAVGLASICSRLGGRVAHRFQACEGVAAWPGAGLVEGLEHEGAEAGGAGDEKLQHRHHDRVHGLHAARSEYRHAVGSDAAVVAHTGPWGTGAYGGDRGAEGVDDLLEGLGAVTAARCLHRQNVARRVDRFSRARPAWSASRAGRGCEDLQFSEMLLAMKHRHTRGVYALALGLIGLSACKGSDSSEETSDTVSETSMGVTGAATSNSSTTDTPGEPTTGGAESHAVCDAYLACIAAVMPGALPTAQAGFGEDGTCWQGSAEEAQQCLDGCANGKAMYHEAFPDAPACYVCASNDDCAAGENCFKGSCAVGCGNGLVEPGEVCDSGGDCYDKCNGPGECSPLTNEGCDDGYACTLDFPGGDYEYQSVACDLRGESVGLGGNCNGTPCNPGLICMVGEKGACGEVDDCCVQVCDTAASNTCSDGRTCNALQGHGVVPYNLEGWLQYLGVCLPPE